MPALPDRERILIFDFGSQYGQLIARRVREQNVFCQIVRHDLPAGAHRRAEAARHHLLRRPGQRLRARRPDLRPEAVRPRHPGPGHLLRHAAGLSPAGRRGRSRPPAASSAGPSAASARPNGLFAERAARNRRLDEPRRSGPRRSAATSCRWPRRDTCPVAAVRHRSRPIYGLQFHPEVSHTPVRRPHPAQLPLRCLRLPGPVEDRLVPRTDGRGVARRGSATSASSAGCPAASIRR